MEAKELMIGDWVYDESNAPHQINELGTTFCTNKNTDLLFTERLKPIPITEDILKTNGFRESSIECGCYYFPEWYQELNGRGFAVETDDKGRFWITDHQLMMIRYVHTFQQALRLCGLKDLANNLKID